MIYRYFVSYFGKRKNGTYNVGHVVISRPTPIEEPDDITSLSKDLQTNNEHVTPTVILSYKLMSKVNVK